MRKKKKISLKRLQIIKEEIKCSTIFLSNVLNCLTIDTLFHVKYASGGFALGSKIDFT